MAFVEDNATISSIPYFESHVFRISLPDISVSIALKFIINNSVLK